MKRLAVRGNVIGLIVAVAMTAVTPPAHAVKEFYATGPMVC